MTGRSPPPQRRKLQNNPKIETGKKEKLKTVLQKRNKNKTGARNENKTQSETESVRKRATGSKDQGAGKMKWKWRENSNHKLGIYLRSVNDYHLKCARLPPKNQLLEKAQPSERPEAGGPPGEGARGWPKSGWQDTVAEGVKGPKATYVFYA